MGRALGAGPAPHTVLCVAPSKPAFSGSWTSAASLGLLLPSWATVLLSLGPWQVWCGGLSGSPAGRYWPGLLRGTLILELKWK